MASVPRAQTLLNVVPREEMHESPIKMVPPDFRRGSNTARSGVRNYYEELKVDEHGHALAIRSVLHMTHKQLLLKEKRGMQLYS